MNVHPELGHASPTSDTTTQLTTDNSLSNKIKRSLSITFEQTSPVTGPKSPTSPTKQFMISLGSKKSGSNMRPKSASALPKHGPISKSIKEASRTHALTSSERAVENNPYLRTQGVPHLGRSPSTPVLRSFQHKSTQSQDLQPIEDELPHLVPSITFSQDKTQSSSLSLSSDSSSSSSTPASTAGTPPNLSPSTTSISSSDTTEDESEESPPLDITAFLAAPRLTQRVRLKNGRVLSFSEVGDRNGFPVFVFLGMGCVRYFIAFFDDLALSYGLRLICPDRPGVGLSDNVKPEDQQVLKWPEVINELCDILNIKKFFIMAHSAGAPYALACALKMPHRLQGTIYLVCPWVSTAIANNFKWIRFVPTPIMKLTNTAGISLQQMLYGRQPYSTKPSHRNSGALASPMSNLEKKQQLGLAILKASFAENLAGANNDLLMCFERKYTFGFSYTDVDHPVHVFHGTKDERIPVSAVKWMEQEMPECKLTLIEGGKHSLLLRAEVVDTIFKSIAVQLHVKDECRVCKISSKCWLMEESVNSTKERVEVEEPAQEVTRNRRRSLSVKTKNIKNDQRKSTRKNGLLPNSKFEVNNVPKSGEKLVAVYSYF